MIAEGFKGAFSKEWMETYIPNSDHELRILQQVIPWQKIIDNLKNHYNEKKGRFGTNLRTIVAVLILAKLRQLSDGAVIMLIQENRYAQYLCNVSDRDISVFLERSTLVKFRRRIGPKGIQTIELLAFEILRTAGVIENDAALIDSTVLANNIIYPNDVDLIFKAFEKIADFCGAVGIDIFWNHGYIKKRWRDFCLNKKRDRLVFLLEFFSLFQRAWKRFKKIRHELKDGYQKRKHIELLDIFKLLKGQTRQKLNGKTHMGWCLRKPPLG